MRTIHNIQPKAYKRCGTVYQPKETMNTYNAEIVPRKYIKIWGTYRNRINGPVEFRKMFEIGDWAEHDSYNLKYSGQIVQIGENSITIESYPGTCNARKHRLDLWAFCWRNWDYDRAEHARYNAEEMLHL